MEQRLLVMSKATGKIVPLPIKDFSKATANKVAEIIVDKFIKTGDANAYTWYHDIVLKFDRYPSSVSFYIMLEASTHSYHEHGYHLEQ